MEFAARLFFLQQVQRLFSQEAVACHIATAKSGSSRGGVYILWAGFTVVLMHPGETVKQEAGFS